MGSSGSCPKPAKGSVQQPKRCDDTNQTEPVPRVVCTGGSTLPCQGGGREFEPHTALNNHSQTEPGLRSTAHYDMVSSWVRAAASMSMVDGSSPSLCHHYCLLTTMFGNFQTFYQAQY